MRKTVALALCLACNTVLSKAQDLSELAQMDLEDLLSTTVTSISKKEETGFQAAAAVYVITQETIRRSGYNSIPELFRLVPGMEVGRFGGNDYAISARGFASASANKLLVLMNGRSLYNSPFGGTWWDVQDYILADIERIEVIRGPGAALWGSNAVNGVINIITKDSIDTKGSLISASAGNQERAVVSFRHGFATSDNSDGRIYAKVFERSENELYSDGSPAGDLSRMGQAGFEWDWETDKNSLNLEGRLFQAQLNLFGPDFTPPPAPRIDRFRNNTNHSGGHILSSWTHRYDSNSDTTLKFFINNFNRDQSTNSNFSRTVYDIDMHTRHELNESNELIWGLNYRLYDDKFISSRTVTWDPIYRKLQLYSGFIQNQTKLDESLTLTLSSRFEHNEFSGFEYQPNARIAWTPAQEFTLWGAFSRAVRIPTRQFEDGNLLIATVPVPGLDSGITIGAAGISEGLEAEDLYAYEIGARYRATEHISFDVSAYFNRYIHLIFLNDFAGSPVFDTIDVQGTTIPVSNASFDFGDSANVYGLEGTVNLIPTSWWKVQASYWHIQTDISRDNSNTDPGISPVRNHQAVLRSLMDLSDSVALDTVLRYGDTLSAVLGDLLPSSDAYIQLDVRVGWNITPDIELSLVGRDLLAPSRLEFVDEFSTIPIAIRRSIYGRLNWSF